MSGYEIVAIVERFIKAIAAIIAAIFGKDVAEIVSGLGK